jgi:BMFP domain-containing protein YqiC
LPEKISIALGRMDLLLKENFELKREIVFERKKYSDLQQAFQDLRHNVSNSDVNLTGQESPEKQQFL